MLLRRLAQHGFTVTLADLQAMDEWEPGAFTQPLAEVQAYDIYRQWGHRLEKISDEGLLEYVAAIEELRKQTDA